MAEKLNDVLAEVKAAMAAEKPAAQPEQPAAPEGEPMAEPQPAEETPAAEPTAEAPTAPETEVPAAPAAPAEPAVDYGALIEQQNTAIRQMQEQLAASDKLVNQQAQLAEDAINATLEMPRLEIADPFDGNATARAISEYNEKMNDYIAKKIEAETAPMKRKYEQEAAEAARSAVKSKMRGDTRYTEFGAMETDLDALIANDPDLSHMDPSKAYATAYLIARGLAGEKPAPVRTATDIADEAYNNADVMRILEQRKAEDARKAQSAVPKIPGGNGAVPATPISTPKTLKEAGDIVRKLWR